MPSTPERRGVRLRDVDRHQRRSVLQQRRRRGLHDRHATSGSNAQHPQQGAARRASTRIPCCIHEGDTPAFLGLIDNGLASAMSPAYGGWGGRYVWRQPHGETAAVLDAGRRLVPRPRQLARHRRRRRRPELHVRPGDDLAVARRRFSTTSPRAWTGRSRRRRRRTTTRWSSVNGRPGHRAARDRSDGRSDRSRSTRPAARDPDGNVAALQLDLLCGRRDGNSRFARPRTPAPAAGAAPGQGGYRRRPLVDHSSRDRE